MATRARIRDLYTKLLKKKVRMLGRAPNERDLGRLGHIVNVYLDQTRPGPWYTVMLKDGRLVETDGTGIVVEG
jgi:hypothetical protein